MKYLKKFFKTVGVVAMASMLMLGSACGGGGVAGEEPSVDKEGNTIIKIMFHVNETSAEGQAYKKRGASRGRQNGFFYAHGR